MATQLESAKSTTLDNIMTCRANGGTPERIYNNRGELIDSLCDMDD